MGKIDLLLGQRVYLDSNIFIYALENVADFGEVARAILEKLDSQEFIGVSSELTLSECLSKPNLSSAFVNSLAIYSGALQNRRSLSLVPVSKNILIDSAKLRAKKGYKLPDAIHMATALAEKCSFFLTNDKRFGKTSGIQTLILSEISK